MITFTCLLIIPFHLDRSNSTDCLRLQAPHLTSSFPTQQPLTRDITQLMPITKPLSFNESVIRDRETKLAIIQDDFKEETASKEKQLRERIPRLRAQARQETEISDKLLRETYAEIAELKSDMGGLPRPLKRKAPATLSE